MNERAQPKKMSTAWRAWRSHRQRVVSAMERVSLCEFSEVILDGIEARANKQPTSRVGDLHESLIELLHLPDLHQRPADLKKASEIYREARELTFRVDASLQRHREQLADLTTNASLLAIQRDELLEIDLLAHEDADFECFVTQMIAKLDAVKSAPDSIAYSQVFEIYAEAMVLRFLRGRGIRTTRIRDDISAPDFECQLDDGRPYFVEVKALDIVDGPFRHNEIMEDGLEPNIELESRLCLGKEIATATGEIAPYRKAFGAGGYDPFSQKLVIDTLRDKCRQAFKASQFKRGPTIALVVADRLILHGWKSALAPYYFEESHRACVSGAIWNAAFGRAGAPVLRLPDFEGKPSVEGYLDRSGLYADDSCLFPSIGLVVLQKSSSRRLSYGLKAPGQPSENWTSDDTEEVLHAMCDAWNDGGNSHGFKLSKYEIEP